MLAASLSAMLPDGTAEHFDNNPSEEQMLDEELLNQRLLAEIQDAREAEEVAEEVAEEEDEAAIEQESVMVRKVRHRAAHRHGRPRGPPIIPLSTIGETTDLSPPAAPLRPTMDEELRMEEEEARCIRTRTLCGGQCKVSRLPSCPLHAGNRSTSRDAGTRR